MKYFQSVLAFGDSHIAGCELSDQYNLEDYTSGRISIEEADAPGKKLAFPQIIADELNVPCYNYAMTGGSNDRSLRLLTRVIQNHPNSLVLFGYTCTDRKEFYYPDPGNFLGRDKDNFIQVGSQWRGKIKDGMDHPINEQYLKIARPYNNLKELMFIIDSICTNNALDFLHIPLFPETLPSMKNLFDFEGDKNYLDWCKENNFKQLPFFHYEQSAHKALSKLILDHLSLGI
jgi:hypothetical protein